MITRIANVENFQKANQKFIEENVINYKFDEAIKILEKEKFYNFRIIKGNKYHLFGDIDKCNFKIERYFEILIKFLLDEYNIGIHIDDIKYTQNNDTTKQSYHYSIPKISGNTEDLKKFHINLKKYISKKMCLNKKISGGKTFCEGEINDSCIDTTIYSNHWYRAPNQYKGETNKESKQYNKHIIKRGALLDFIPEYYENEMVLIPNQKLETSQKKKNILSNNITPIQNNNQIVEITSYENATENTLSKLFSKSHLCQQIFDECYQEYRFNEYGHWTTIGMAIKNTFNYEEAFKLFDYFSSKGNNYGGSEETEIKFQSFITKKDALTIATIYYYAIEDNKPKFIEIINKNTFDLEQTDICKYLKLISNNRFIYQTINSNSEDKHKLYVFNGKYWENNSILMKNVISTQLYEFLKKILVEVFWNHRDFNLMRNKIEKLKNITYKKDLVETYKEYGINDDIKFDDKWNLFCFKNKVYDLQQGNFRDYEYDDYVTAHTGFNWKEPTHQEIENVEKLISSIMPNEDEKNTLLQILSTGLDGLPLEHFIVLNGSGGNGKGVLNDLFLTCLGNYGFIGNNAILFESGSTGSNPEKANIHKKRYVVFREPPANKKFNNAFVKEISGGGKLAARGHMETNTEKELNCTVVVECNERPRFSEEPTDGEKRRLIDILYKSKFTNDTEQIDEKNGIFKADAYYKTKEFQEKHKYALLKILFNVYKQVYQNKRVIIIAPSIKKRTESYLELSCLLLPWFKENYQFTSDKKDYIKVIEIYEDFKNSEMYYNMSRYEKKKFDKNYFINYFETNILTRKYYKVRHNNYRNVITEFTKTIELNLNIQ